MSDRSPYDMTEQQKALKLRPGDVLEVTYRMTFRHYDPLHYFVLRDPGRLQCLVPPEADVKVVSRARASQGSVKLTLPGRFDEFLSGTSMAAGEDGYERLGRLYATAQHVPHGKGTQLVLHLDPEHAIEDLAVLAAYAESNIAAVADNLQDPALTARERFTLLSERSAAIRALQRINEVVKEIKRLGVASRPG